MESLERPVQEEITAYADRRLMEAVLRLHPSIAPVSEATLGTPELRPTVTLAGMLSGVEDEPGSIHWTYRFNRAALCGAINQRTATNREREEYLAYWCFTCSEIKQENEEE